MATFNITAGFAAMGDAISKTAGAMTLEMQKADLQQKAAILADQLATTRESKGRAEQHGYTLETLDKTQKYDAEKTDKQIAADLHRTNISAGASLEGTRLQIAARAAENDKTIAATLQAASKIQIDSDGNLFSVNPATNTVAPLKNADGTQLTGRDPEVARAMAELVKSKTAQLNDITRTYTPQIQSLETTIRELQKNMIPGDAGRQRDLTEAQARLKALQSRFDSEKGPLNREIDEYGRWLRSKSKAPGATPSGDIDWNKYMPKPAGPDKSPGIIDGWVP